MHVVFTCMAETKLNYNTLWCILADCKEYPVYESVAQCGTLPWKHLGYCMAAGSHHVAGG